MSLLTDLLPAIITGASAAGNVIGAKQQTNALSQAQAGSSAATDRALQIIMSLYDQSRNDLSGFRALGTPALQQLSALTYRGKTPGGAPAGGGVDFSKLPQTNTNALLQGFGGSGGSAGLPAGGYGNPNLVPQQNASNAGTRSAIGGAVGLGAGILPGLLGVSALGGPVGLAIGGAVAGVGALIGKLWNNHNPDKTWASNAINDVSKEVWGQNLDGKTGLYADVQAGRKTPEQGKQEFALLWNGWKNAMANAGVDKSIIDRSVQSQRGYFKDAFNFFNGAAPQTPAAPPPAAPVNPLLQTGQPNNLRFGVA